MESICLWSPDYYLAQGISKITDELDIDFLQATTKHQFKSVIENTPAKLYFIDIESFNVTGESKTELTKEILEYIGPGDKNRVIFLTKFQRNVIGMLLNININILDTRKTAIATLKKIIKNVIDNEEKSNLNYFIGNPSRPLSKRERSILESISSGKQAYTIAKSMNIDYKTVQAHKHNVIKNFSFNNPAELYKALRWFEH